LGKTLVKRTGQTGRARVTEPCPAIHLITSACLMEAKRGLEEDC